MVANLATCGNHRLQKVVVHAVTWALSYSVNEYRNRLKIPFIEELGCRFWYQHRALLKDMAHAMNIDKDVW